MVLDGLGERSDVEAIFKSSNRFRPHLKTIAFTDAAAEDRVETASFEDIPRRDVVFGPLVQPLDTLDVGAV